MFWLNILSDKKQTTNSETGRLERKGVSVYLFYLQVSNGSLRIELKEWGGGTTKRCWKIIWKFFFFLRIINNNCISGAIVESFPQAM